MRVDVVGSTGVLGRALIPALLEHQHEVLALARSPTKAHKLLPKEAEIVQSDLLSPGIGEQLPTLLTGCEAVFHIATAIPSDMTSPHAWDTNTRLRTEGTSVLLQASVKAGVKRYIQQSITMAYPDCGDEWITEVHPLDTSPRRALICKPVITMENLVRRLTHHEMQWCILRGGSFVGPGTAQDRTIADLRAGRHVVAGRGQNFVSLIHVADMAAACVAALAHAPHGSVFNIVDEPIREGDYLDRMADSMGVARPRRDETVPASPSWRCSNRLAKSTLFWSPCHQVIRLQP